LSDAGPAPLRAESGELGLKLVANMPRLTLDRIGEAGFRNARANLPFLDRGRSLRDLRGAAIGAGDRALVIAAGPSLQRRRAADEIGSHAYDGAVLATDSAMRYCLKSGIVPHLVVTLDPHAKRIVRWFGDPQLSADDLDADDYFSRQDMDRAFNDQLSANLEMIELLNSYGRRMRLALSTSASPAVVQRAVATGMEIYWWNPMYDDPDAPGSVSRELQAMTGLPCMNAMGNVGSACWMMAHAVLGKRHVALAGMDFSYYDGTPYRSTQYFHDAVALVGEDKLDSLFIRVFNPHVSAWFYADPAYLWYRNIFLEMAPEADCTTYNCTEGGILFGEGVRFVRLKDFLSGAALEGNANATG